MMKLFNRKKKSKETKKITVSQLTTKSTSDNYFTLFNESSRSRLTFRQLYYFYDRISPLATAISWIVDEAVGISPVLYNTVKKEYILDHPILDLLRKPNPFVSRNNFFKTLYTTYLTTGNAFIVSSGVNEPQYLQTKNPNNITIYAGNDGYPGSYEITSNQDNKRFYRQDNTATDEIRYQDEAALQQIYQIREYNAEISVGDFFGKSILESIYYELEQHGKQSEHNLSLLENGGRMSGILSTVDSVDPDQMNQIRASLNNNYAGTENAGKIAVIDGLAMQYNELGKTPKDMDFLSLRKVIEETVYKRFRIPLPLINQDKATFSNMNVSMLGLYDNVVLPFLKNMFDEFSRLLFNRYDGMENLILTYDESTISALETRRLEQAKSMAGTSVMTINEIRSELLLDPLDGGDELFAAANLVPIASVGKVDEED